MTSSLPSSTTNSPLKTGGVLILSNKCPSTAKSVTESLSKGAPMGWTTFFDEKMEDLRAISDAIGEVQIPKVEHIFEAYHLTPLSQVRVVILGIEPHAGVRKGCSIATGLAWSKQISEGNTDTFRNITTEVIAEYPDADCTHNCLNSWASQGVFLLNASLTHEKQGKYNRHLIDKVWDTFIIDTLKTINSSSDKIVWLCWGKELLKLLTEIGVDVSKNNPRVLQTGHPSPSNTRGGFLGSKCFSKANALITGTPIDWSLSS